MASSFGSYRSRRRRAAAWRLLMPMIAIGLLAASAAYGYQVGASARQARIAKLEADVDRFRERSLDLGDQLTVARERTETAEAALADMRARYAAEVPQGDMAELVDTLRAELRRGATLERLAFLIEAARRPAACEDEPETKRFMPRTPVSQGPASAVRLGDDRILVTGRGEPALSPENLPEAWFDPAQPVAITFTTLDGGSETVEGVLPLRHSLVVDGREYRVSVIAGERAFVEVTAQACALPEVPAEAVDDGESGEDPAT